MKEIPLTQGKVVLVDNEDYEMISKHNWSISHRNYVTRNIFTPMVKGKRKHWKVYMHRQIMKVNGESIIDHINGNELDNRKTNLRICTQRENSYNSKISKNNTSGFKGVTWRKSRKKWVAQIMYKRKGYGLGYFTDKIEAAKAYNEAAKKYFGEFAKLNEV